MSLNSCPSSHEEEARIKREEDESSSRSGKARLAKEKLVDLQIK